MKKKQYPQPYPRRGIYYFTYWKDGIRHYKATGKRTKAQAREFIEEFMEKLDLTSKTFREYCRPFFHWDECPHVQRLAHEEGKSIGRTHVSKCRAWLEQYILPDPIARIPLTEITRGDILDFRTRLLRNLKDHLNTANKVLSVLKVVFAEAYHRGEIHFDPAQRLGKVREDRSRPGTFTGAELAVLFPPDSFGPWQELMDFGVFLTAATTGMRRGEILALQWRDVDLEARIIYVRRAWKDEKELGEPKWGKTRAIPLPDVAGRILRRLMDESIRTASEDLVFCYDSGARLGATWWQKRFIQAMEKAGIDRVGRKLKPHSFRHTLNSLLLEAEKSPEKIRAALGWSNEAVQREFYTHLQIDGLRDQAELVDGLFEK